MATRIRSLIAFAHVADVARSIRFYADLGFTVGNSVTADDGQQLTWAWLESDKATLMVGLASGAIDSAQQAILFYLYVDDIRATRNELVRLGHAPGEIRYPFYMPGGECRHVDPDGYVLMLAQT